MKNFLFEIYNNHNTLRTEVTLFGIKFKIHNERLINTDYTKPLNKIKKKLKKNENIIADAIPDAVRSKIPINKPIIP